MQSAALEFGVISTLRTGHAVYDLMICMAVPAVIQAVINSGKDTLEVVGVVRNYVRDLVFAKKYVTHVVETTEHRGKYGLLWRDSKDGRRNELLQKAILLYLTEYLNLSTTSACVQLLERPSMKQKLIDDHIPGLETEKQKRILALLTQKDAKGIPEVAKLGAGRLPQLLQWVNVGNGVEFMNEMKLTSLDSSSSVDEIKEIFLFRSSAPDGAARIDAFIHKAFEFYRETENKKFKDDTARYMYVHSDEKPPKSDADDETKVDAPYHKRYALGDDKTFDNVFFSEKQQLIKLIDNFVNKTGKFAISGFPYKLGLLLYGPPGTGKTSLIKAVAQYTGRHIVNISLSKIKTNQELMDAMFDLRYAVDGLDLPVRMEFKDVVFVMEDIDCATSVVAPRATNGRAQAVEVTETNQTNANEKYADTGEQQPSVGKDRATESSEDLEIIDNGSEGDFDEGYEASYGEETLFGGLGEHGDLFAAFLAAQTGGIVGQEFGPKMKGGFVSSSNSSDKLSLAGLLNVLDGVIDCPGRIVIMTTNHPEKLDPALIRPGRISKKLHLSYMGDTETQEMIEYYFSTKLTIEQSERLRAGGDKRTRNLSPAYIEELCAECDDIDAILDRIANETT